jgi:hypothetical protein
MLTLLAMVVSVLIMALPISVIGTHFSNQVSFRRDRLCELSVGNYTTLVLGPMEYIVMLVTSYFRYLASAAEVHWQEPKPLLGSPNRRLRAQGDQGRGGIGYRFTV